MEISNLQNNKSPLTLTIDIFYGLFFTTILSK